MIEETRTRAARETGRSADATLRGGSDRSVLVRNYDGSEVHTLHVRLRDDDGEVAFERPVAVGPLETVTVETRLERAVYRVEVRLGDEAVSANCLVGSGLAETAVVETGNGVVSVVEGGHAGLAGRSGRSGSRTEVVPES